MNDSIGLLESIGKNASLRHASKKDLMHELERMHACDPLKQAAASGDAGSLRIELGAEEQKVVQSPPGPPPAKTPSPEMIPPPPPHDG
jgi:hypothetical protein